MRGQSSPNTIDVLPLSVRADVASVDRDKRTVELVFSTGAAVERYDWLRDMRYVEVLSLKPEHVRIDRLNAAGPLLNSHSAWSLSSQIGIVEPGSVRITGKEGIAKVRVSRRPDVEPIWTDVMDGIYRSVSVGYRVYEFHEQQGKNNALPVRTAVDWEPYEVSMVAMPADIGAHVRGERPDTNPCRIVRVAADQDLDLRYRLARLKARAV